MARILVADDDRQLVELLRAMLDEAGFEVEVAHSGLAAADLIEREDFDLVVLDVLMPGMSGDALADLLHSLRPQVPALLITGDSGDQFVRSAHLPRLRKPFSEYELVEAVRGLLAEPGPGQASA
jgi:CheY-like chemotaxis protein